MGKEDLIVDNPLLLTSLFKSGVFFIPEQKNTEELIQESEPSNSGENPVSEITSIDSNIETKAAELEVQIPDTDVIHIVAELGTSAYRTEIIPNTMNAIGKLLKGGMPGFEIIDFKDLAIPLEDYVQRVSPRTKLVIWASESPETEGLKNQSKRILLLSMPSVMLSSQEKKADHWNRIKAFFLENQG